MEDAQPILEMGMANLSLRALGAGPANWLAGILSSVALVKGSIPLSRGRILTCLYNTSNLAEGRLFVTAGFYFLVKKVHSHHTFET